MNSLSSFLQSVLEVSIRGYINNSMLNSAPILEVTIDPDVAYHLMMVFEAYLALYLIYMVYCTSYFFVCTIVRPVVLLVSFVINLPWRTVQALSSFLQRPSRITVSIVEYKNYKLDRSSTHDLMHPVRISSLAQAHNIDLAKCQRVLVSHGAATIQATPDLVLQNDDTVLVFHE